MHVDPQVGLLIAAVTANGLLAGASGDQSIKQLPARRRIGVIAYSAYSRAGDLGRGLVWYPLLGGGTTLLSIAAGVAALTHGDIPLAAPAWVLILATAGQVALTGLAAPTNHAQRRHPGDPAALERIFNRFARLQAIRWALNLTALAAAVWALVAYPMGG